MDPIERRDFLKGTDTGVFAFTVGGVAVLLSPRDARTQNVPFRLLKADEAQAIEALGETLAARSGKARSSARISGTSTIEVSSTTSKPQSRGASSLRRKAPVLGWISSRRWMVLASSPVLSDRRFAARPVGAQTAMATALASRIFSSE